jgi:hypothetical protein
MDKRIIVTVVYSTLGLINASGFALAETVGRLECSVVGTPSQEPIGDRDGHGLATVQISCSGVSGLLKDAVYTSSSTSEWDGSQGTYFAGGGIIRVPGGLAATQLNEGVGSATMKDGKPAGVEASGKTLIKFASGTLAELSGKAVRWEAKPAGFNRFSLEFTTDTEAGTIGKSKE